MKVLCVIPARYASTRLPGKPLSMIAGKPMIQHVYERACQAQLPNEVVVATDNELVEQAVLAFDGKAVMTSPDHPSGTDRLAEVALMYPDVDVIYTSPMKRCTETLDILYPDREYVTVEFSLTRQSLISI